MHPSDGTAVELAITRDNRANAEHAASLLSAIVNSSDDAIIGKDLNGVITSWNRSAQRLFGYSADEAIGKTVAELLIPDDRQNEETILLDRLRGGHRVDHFETVRRCKDGRLVEISLTISPMRDALGHVIGASKIARDISERKRSDAAIQILNAQLHAELAAMRRIHQLSIRTLQGEDFGILLREIVDSAIEISGADMGNIQLLENGVLKIGAHRGFHSDFLNFFDRVEGDNSVCGVALARGERVVVEDIEFSPIFAGTEALNVMLRAGSRAVQSTPLVTRTGEIVGMISTHYRQPTKPSERDLWLLDILARQSADVIDRHRSERALRVSEERFRLAQKAAKIGVFELDIENGVNTWSSELEELYGLPAGSFGKTQACWENLIYPADREFAVEKAYEAINSGMPAEAEWRIIWPDGSVHWIAARFQVYRNSRGNAAYLRGVNFEISERKRIETELQRSNEALSQFSYAVSHDLQAPVRSVSALAQLLTSCLDGPKDDSRHVASLIEQAAQGMERLINSLLRYAQAGQGELKRERVSVDAIVDAVRISLSSLIASTGARISYSDLPIVDADPTLLEQLFQNLIANAIRYQRVGFTPEIEIRGEPVEGQWQFSVKDNGEGIALEHQEYIFQALKRLHGSDAPGSGLGLALCKTVVSRHGGQIWVESKGRGQGATFFFTLAGVAPKLQTDGDAEAIGAA